MDRIFTCIALEHDWRWTLAAGLICLLGVAGAFAMLKHARTLETSSRHTLAMAAALIGGSALFATHFTAMQGYRVGAALRYDAGLTAASYLIVAGAIALACLLLLSRASRWNRAVAAVLGIAGVAAMHFVGVYALELPGALSWNPSLAALSVVGAIAIAGLSGLMYRPTPLGLTLASIGGALAVIWLHFVAMAALEITPSALSKGIAGSVSAAAMTGLLSLIVLGLAATGAVIGWLAFLSRSSALARIRQAIDASPDGLAFYDEADRLVLWNQRYAEVNPELVPNLKVGMVFRDIIQIGLDQRLYDDAVGREAEWLTERLAARQSDSAVMEQRISGDRWLRVMDRRTDAGGVVTVCSDITDLKRQAAELAEARDAAQAASTSKTQFLANMSHEIRTPLNGVVGCAQALAATELTAQQTEMLDLIQSSSRTLQVLLSDILDLARVESGRLELTDDAFDLGAAVREAAQLYEASARDKGLQFFVEVGPEADRWILGDVVRLKQILTNLVSNAVKFTETGFVGLSASLETGAAGQALLRFCVEDTGIGFDCETRERLFSRFEQADGAITRRFGGSGLGLAISRQLAEMMGGDLDCESEPGGGSAFILTVPLREAATPEATAPVLTVATTESSGPLRVLMADDHPVNRKVVEMILAQIDVALTSVEDGAQAVKAAREGDFDLILMDMQMPVMDGLTATREIRLHEAAMGLPRTPLIMLTANALAEHIASAEAAGADRHMAKPFDAAELLAAAGEARRGVTAHTRRAAAA